MLQHLLLRVLSLHAFPYFLNSFAYAEVRAELLEASPRRPIHTALEVELEALRDGYPAPPKAGSGYSSPRAARSSSPSSSATCRCPACRSPASTPPSSCSLGTRPDVVGRGCGFLQGEATDAAAVEVIREAIRSHEAVNVTLRNYRRDGTPFLNLLSLSPVFDARGLCRYMVGSLTEVLPQYVGMKPQLRQADRLHKMLPRRLPMPSSADAEQRMLRVRVAPSRASRRAASSPRADDGSGGLRFRLLLRREPASRG